MLVVTGPTTIFGTVTAALDVLVVVVVVQVVPALDAVRAFGGIVCVFADSDAAVVAFVGHDV
jgi:hypothetical protein